MRGILPWKGPIETRSEFGAYRLLVALCTGNLLVRVPRFVVAACDSKRRQWNPLESDDLALRVDFCHKDGNLAIGYCTGGLNNGREPNFSPQDSQRALKWFFRENFNGS